MPTCPTWHVYPCPVEHVAIDKMLAACRAFITTQTIGTR